MSPDIDLIGEQVMGHENSEKESPGVTLVFGHESFPANRSGKQRSPFSWWQWSTRGGRKDILGPGVGALQGAHPVVPTQIADHGKRVRGRMRMRGPSRAKATSAAQINISGKWRITEMDLWDREGIDLLGRAMIEFKGEGG